MTATVGIPEAVWGDYYARPSSALTHVDKVDAFKGELLTLSQEYEVKIDLDVRKVAEHIELKGDWFSATFEKGS